MQKHFRNCRIEVGGCWCDFKRYCLLLAITLLIFGIELCGGLWSGSLALLSDAGHLLGDAFAFVVALVVFYLVRREPAKESQFRFFGALAHAALLFSVVIGIVCEALGRFNQPREIIEAPLLVSAIIGCAGNFLQHRILNKSAENRTKQGLNVHILTDFWQSLAVIANGFLVAATNETRIDILVSLLIALATLLGIYKLVFPKKGGTSHSR